ncbi:endo-1,4-beta-xylanase [Glycomyces salinus]|uniref:endo-1,4-beta-xylanase n=1 Tax=Glycomyces salinus TaxID=980294 RepID=UPI0018ED5158|nr:endo-1,4-beta-xylanase [Glycomyces salinus]
MLQTRTRRRAWIAGIVAAVVAFAGVALSAQYAHAQTTLRGAADALGIDIGVAVDVNKLQNDQTYRDIVATEFNSVTAENVMKMETLQPSKGQYNFGQADTLVAFAQQNGQSVYGHTLVWHSQSPDWVENESGQTLRQSMQDHITTVMDHFEGDVFAWDVVNEVVSDNNGQLRDSFWLQGLGESYITDAFEFARQADPNADLYMNDYSIDGINAKSDRYYELAQGLVNQGLLDGMGFQAHLILGQVPGNMEQNLQRFADLGLKVRITELDIRMDLPSSQQMFEQQAQDFERVVNICTNLADCSGVTVWGVRDSDSWVPDVFDGQGDPLLFNDDGSKKPAYDAVLNALGGDPDETTPPDDTTPPDETTPPADGDCTARIEVVNDWGSGWQANVSVTAGQAAVDGWTLTWDWPSGQSISSSWNADISTSGSTVTAGDVGWNAGVGAGQTREVFGFIGSGTSAEPSVTCQAG